MVTKSKAKKKKSSSKAKKGSELKCDVCGMVVTVADPCNCDPCGISCCGQEMEMVTCCK